MIVSVRMALWHLFESRRFTEMLPNHTQPTTVLVYMTLLIGHGDQQDRIRNTPVAGLPCPLICAPI